MRFSKGRDHRRDAEVSVTPLIDLFLNILVFFLVATTFSTDSLFFVDLPEAGPGEKAAERKSFVINVDDKGEISMDRQLVSLNQLKARLESVPPEQRGQMPFVVRADRNTRHGAVVSVIDVARSLGMTNLGIVTQPQKNP